MVPETKNTVYPRFFATKTTIKEVLLGNYLQEDDQEPNYLLTPEQKKIFRVNIFATVVNKEQLGSITNFLIDDGTDKIIIRFFEDNKSSKTISVGDVLLVIGRIRVYHQEKYIASEIVKKINPLWLKVRSLELNNCLRPPPMERNTLEKKYKSAYRETERIELEGQSKENQEENIENVSSPEQFDLPTQKLKEIISELDSGKGVFIEEIIELSPLDNTEQLLEKMLESGKIFQIVPGKVKVL